MNLLLPVLLTILAAPAKPLMPQAKENVPIPFRCDNMSMDGLNYKINCRGNVIVKYDTLLLCCDKFEAQADKQWQWQTVKCQGRVRAYMDERWLWGNEGEYLVDDQILEIRGEPLLKQGMSWFTGSKVLVYSATQQVQLEQPRGTLVREIKAVQPPKINSSRLPGKCPLPLRDKEQVAVPDDGSSDE